MKQVSINDPEHGEIMAQSYGMAFRPPNDVCFGTVEDGLLLGGAIISDYTGRSCSIHTTGWGAGWLTRPLLWATFNYIFGQLDCERVFGIVDESNTSAIVLAHRCGLKEVARLVDMFPGGDGVVLSLAKYDCKWVQLKPPHKSLFLENINGPERT